MSDHTDFGYLFKTKRYWF